MDSQLRDLRELGICSTHPVYPTWKRMMGLLSSGTTCTVLRVFSTATKGAHGIARKINLFAELETHC